MSWSFSAVGKPAAVAAKAKEESERYPCQEPEETVRQSIFAAIIKSCEGFDDKTAVKVYASGSQSSQTRDGEVVVNYNSAMLNIEPLHNFLLSE